MDRSDLSKPEIKLGQENLDAVGVLKDSVNYFQGMAHFSANIFSMPGRIEEDGLGYDLNISYEGSSAEEFGLRNNEVGTGILGLGWEMPVPEIYMNNPEERVKASQSYTICMDGVCSELARDMSPEFLFRAAGRVIGDGEHPEKYVENVRAMFSAVGIPLSEKENVTIRKEDGEETYLVIDAEAEAEYRIVQRTESGGEESTYAYSGGESYQMVKYQFWRILYYPRFEKWAVTKEDGTQFCFGGDITPDAPGGEGNAVLWKVYWKTDHSAWFGDSVYQEKTGSGEGMETQRRFAVGWKLRRIIGRYETGCVFSYNEKLSEGNENPGNETLDGTTQQVSSGGLAYTKANYLTKITDIYGRTASFLYKDKIWEEQDLKEYFDPHKAIPDSAPNGCQDCYETKYLDRIVLKSGDGNPVYTIQFRYDVVNSGQEPEKDDGYYAKRMLTGYEISYPDGGMRHGYLFDYYGLEPDGAAQEGGNRGALRRIVWPSGGEVCYSYQKQELDNCNLQKVCTAPEGYGEGNAVPGVWFGDGYAAVLWDSYSSEGFTIQIITWDGQWVQGLKDGEKDYVTIPVSGGIDIADLHVMTGKNFVTVDYYKNGRHKLYLFTRHADDRTGWKPEGAETVESGETAPAPFLDWEEDGTGLRFVSGENFFAVLRTDLSAGEYSYQIFTERWDRECRWEKEYDEMPKGSGNAAAFGSDRCFAILDDNGLLTSFYLTGGREWIRTGPVSLEDFPAGFLFDSSHIRCVLNSSIGALSLLVGDSVHYDYVLYLFNWNGEGQLCVNSRSLLKDEWKLRGWTPALQGTRAVLAGGHFLLYDGNSWQVIDELYDPTMESYNSLYYCGGDNWQVMVRMDGTQAEYRLCQCIPSEEEGGWKIESLAQDLPYPEKLKDTALYPSSNGTDSFVLDCQYYRLEHGELKGMDFRNIFGDSASGGKYLFEPSTFTNQSPYFIAGAMRDDFTGLEVENRAFAILIRNGQIDPGSAYFQGEKICSSKERSEGRDGLYPYGNQMFMTYPDSVECFEKAREFTLNRYALDQVYGKLEAWAVSSVTIDNKMDVPFLYTLEQDLDHVSVSVDGKYPKYYGTKVVFRNGEQNLVDLRFFENNGEQEVHSELLDGQRKTETFCKYSVDEASGNRTETQVTRKSWEWGCTRRYAYASDTAGTEAGNLYGAYVFMASFSETAYGAGTEEVYSYDTRDGGLLRPGPKAVSRNSGSGAEMQKTTEYIYKESPETSACHLLGLKEEITEKSQGMMTRHQRNLYGMSLSDTIDLCGTEDSYITDGQDQWIPRKEILQRNPVTGLAVEYRERGKLYASLLAWKNKASMAVFENARLSECGFNGFFPYDEGRPDWTYSAGAEYSDDAVFGNRSLKLPAGASISTKIAVGDRSDPILVGLRYKTGADNMAVSILMAGEETGMAFGSTQGKWSYVTRRYDPAAAAGDELEVKIQAFVSAGDDTTGGSGGFVLADSVVILPGKAGFQAVHMDERKLAPDTSLDSMGNVERLLYDIYGQQIGKTGADGCLKELLLDFIQNGDNTDAIAEQRPNFTVKLQPAGGGSVAVFREGSGWETEWDVVGEAVCRNQRLRLSNGSAPCSLSYRFPEENSAQDVAVYFQMTPQSGGTNSVTITVDGTEVTRKGGQWFREGKLLCGETFGFDEVPGQILLVLKRLPEEKREKNGKNGRLLLIADGKIICSQPEELSSLEFKVTFAGPVEIQQLAVAFSPELTLAYKDAADCIRQIHSLHGLGSYIREDVYDDTGRMLIETRSAQAPSDYGPLLWQPDFFCWDHQNAAAQGKLLDIYKADPGDPYSRMRYDCLDSERLMEEWLPGTAGEGVKDASPAQKKYFYAGDYSGTGQEKPDRLREELETKNAEGQDVSYFTYRDCLGRLRDAKTRLGQEEKQLTRHSYAYTTETAGDGRMVHIEKAEELSPRAIAEGSGFRADISKNSLDELWRYLDSDTGLSEFGYDENGNVISMAKEGADGIFYKSYDACQRLVEEGFLPSTGEAVLRSRGKEASRQADSGKTAAYCGRKYQYGDHDENLANRGRLISVTTAHHDPAGDDGGEEITESWSYGSNGKTQSAEMCIRNGEQEDTIGASYSYNNAERITEIAYRVNGRDTLGVQYGYDDLGRMVSVSLVQDKETVPVAVYGWDCENRVVSSRRGDTAETWAYDPRGDVLGHTVTDGQGSNIFKQSYGYAENHIMKSMAYAFGDGDEKQMAFQYDELCQLVGFLLGSESHTIQYDRNGNVEMTDQEIRIRLQEGTDRICGVTRGDVEETDFQYGADGTPGMWNGTQVTKDPVLDTTAAMESGDTTVKLDCRRGMNDRIAVLTENGTRAVDFKGTGSQTQVYWQGDKIYHCIWGPAGLAAVAVQGQDGGETVLLYPVTDRTGSVWAVLDSSGAARMTFEYHPFGQILSSSGDGSGEWPFTFQGKRYIRGLGLYDFSTRFYDPVLMRFLEPDPARQFISPYTFEGNNPLIFVDPDGSLARWEQALIISIAALVLAATIAVTIVTAGATMPAVAGGTAATGTAVAGGTAASGAAASGMGSLGILLHTVVGTATGILQSMSMNAITYAAYAKGPFSWKDFGSQMRTGAITGTITGAIGGLFTGSSNFLLTSVNNLAGKIAAMSTVNVIGNCAGNILADVATETTITGKEIIITLVASAFQSVSDGLFTAKSKPSSDLTTLTSRMEANSGSVTLNKCFGAAGSMIYTHAFNREGTKSQFEQPQFTNVYPA